MLLLFLLYHFYIFKYHFVLDCQVKLSADIPAWNVNNDNCYDDDDNDDGDNNNNNNNNSNNNNNNNNQNSI